MRVLFAVVVFGVSAGSCLAATSKVQPVPKPKPLPPVRYVCEDGTRLSVQFSAPGATPAVAVLRILGTGKEVTLSQSASADGARYTSDKIELWDKGQSASFKQDDTAVNCRPKR